MNEQDNEAFEKWLDNRWTISDIVYRYSHEAWQAVVEYKQKEINNLINGAAKDNEMINRLQAENKKLREAIREAIDFPEWCGNEYILENALKEVGEE